MFLQELSIQGYKCFGERFETGLCPGLNVLVGENASGKSAVVDAVRLLLMEDEFGRAGIADTDFHRPFAKGAEPATLARLCASFGGLSKAETVAFLPWTDLAGRATLTLEVENKEGKEGRFKRAMWGGVCACVYFTYGRDEPAGVVASFEGYLASRGIAPASAAVLARGHALVARLRPSSGKVPDKENACLATAVHLWQQGGYQQVGEALLCVGRFASASFWPAKHADARHYYCPESESPAVAWRRFLARLLDACVSDPRIADLTSSWTAWAADVRARLPELVACSCGSTTPETPDGTWFRAPQSEGKKRVVDTLGTTRSAPQSGTLVTTIHQAKGETYDAVLLVSSPTKRGDGGHWSQWLDPAGGNGEHARFAYVASSRPRLLLAWAVPADDADAAGRLEELGFRSARSAPGGDASEKGTQDGEEGP